MLGVRTSIEAMGNVVEQQLAADFQLEDLRVGRHIIRDQRNWKLGELNVEYLWWALIEPSFQPPAVLAVVKFKDELRALFRPRSVDDTQGHTPTIKLGDWRDPMLLAFERVNILKEAGGLSLDGIGYHLQIKTWAVDAKFDFSNPRGEGLSKVESALIDTARRIVEIQGNRNNEAYLVMWGKYGKG